MWILTVYSLRVGREQHVPDLFITRAACWTLFNSSYPEGNFGGTSCWMVRSLLQLYTRAQRTICTSVSLRPFTMMFPGFALLRLRSPSFNSQHFSYSNHFQDHGIYTDTHMHTHARRARRARGREWMESARFRRKRIGASPGTMCHTIQHASGVLCRAICLRYITLAYFHPAE